MTPTDELNREDLEHQRERVLHRLTPVLDALAERRRAITTVARAALGSGAPAGNGQLRAAITGAVAGGVVVAAGLWARHAYRARNRIDRRVSRAIVHLAAPRRPSLLGELAADVARAALGYAVSHLRDMVLAKLESAQREPARLEPPHRDVAEPQPQPVLHRPPPLPHHDAAVISPAAVMPVVPSVAVPPPIPPAMPGMPAMPMRVET